MCPKNKKQHGGTRQGSGAPLKYGEETKSVTMRIPISQVGIVKELVKNHLKNIDKNTIIEVIEIGFPKSIIHRKNDFITALIDTDKLVDELNQYLK
jgi:hypothetical protein